MTCTRKIIVASAVVLMTPAWMLGQDVATEVVTSRTDDVATQFEPLEFTEGTTFFTSHDFVNPSPEVVRGQSPAYRTSVARFGWWGVSTSGSPSGVGEWTGLNSTAFWDFDSLGSDGTRTYDFTLSGPMDETTDLDMYFYGPLVSADVQFQRFLHRSGYKPLDAWFDYPYGVGGNDSGRGGPVYVGEDYNETQDHAIRVQELDAKFAGQLTENIKWHIGVWGMKKSGERQSIAMDHDCNNQQCHQVTQSQSISWTTMEFAPGLEINMGPVTVDYTRVMRAFDQSDEFVGRVFNENPADFSDPSEQQYLTTGVVPENFTQIDKFKVGVDLDENNRLYTNAYFGNTHNRLREIDRGFWGLDMRWTNTKYRNLRTTAYAKYYEQDTSEPTFFPEDHLWVAGEMPSEDVRPLVDRQWFRAGLKGRWRPFYNSHNWRGLALVGGYEFQQLQRQFATYDIDGSAGGAVFTQPDTLTHAFNIGPEMRWSSSFDTYLRYRLVTTQNPLFGVREADENVTQEEIDGGFTTSGVTALNTNLPTLQNRIELGGNWAPTYNFMLGAMIGLEMMEHTSHYARFDEDNYPITLTAWYAPTAAWSLSGALGFYQNSVDQDITYGNGHTGRGAEGQDLLPTDYNAQSDVITLATHYRFTPRVTLSGDFQFVRGSNTWYVPDGLSVGDPTAVPPVLPAPVDYESLPTYSAVVLETTRFGAGVDYQLSPSTSCFLKYMYYNYDDISTGLLSGTSHMAMGGMAARF